MNWYYALNGKQEGPASEEYLTQLASSGTINGDTLVWAEGQPDWAPLSQVLPAALATAPVHAPQIGGFAVPAAQKDLYVQQMREGVAHRMPGTMEFAGFWIRVVAKIIDVLILMVPNFIIQFGAGISVGSMNEDPTKPPSPESIAVMLAIMAIGVGINVFYQTFLVSKFGATWGKMAVGLKIVNEDGSKVSTLRAFARVFAEIVSGLSCYIGYIIAGFDSEKRALHDHICSTRVIQTR